MFKRILFSLGVFVLVVGAGVGISHAARPERPVYPTVAEVQQMINNAIAPLQTAINGLSARLALVETAVTGHTSDIQNLGTRVTTLESNQSSPQPTPPFDLDLLINSEVTHDNPTFQYLKVSVFTTNDIQKAWEPWVPSVTVFPMNVLYWGVAHTPDGDVNSKVDYEINGSNGNLIFTMPGNGYGHGTAILVDVYGEYGGKVVKQTIFANTN